MQLIKIESHPHNEFRFRQLDLPYRSPERGDSEKQRSDRRKAIRLQADYEQYCRDNKIIDIRDRDGNCLRKVGDGELHLLDVASEVASLTFSGKNNNSPKTPSRPKSWGKVPKPTKFGAYARRRLLSAGAIVDSDLKETHHRYFFTFTLPGSTPEAYVAMENWSGYLLTNITQVVRNATKAGHYFGCWEYQKRGALHLHLCVAFPKSIDPDQFEAKMKSSWYSSLSRVSEWSGVNLFERFSRKGNAPKSTWQFDAQPVTKSAARYISKYVSKGFHCMDAMPRLHGCNGNPSLQLSGNPHRWWVVSHSLSKLIEEKIMSVTLQALSREQAEEAFDILCEFAVKANPVQPPYRNSYHITDRTFEQNVIGHCEELIFYCHEGERESLLYMLKQLLRQFIEKYDIAGVKFNKGAWHFGDCDLRDEPLEDVMNIYFHIGQTLSTKPETLGAVDSSVAVSGAGGEGSRGTSQRNGLAYHDC